MREPGRRPKVPKVTFYPVSVDAGKSWRLLAHYPGLPVKYIPGFTTKAEAEAWASGPEGDAWTQVNHWPPTSDDD
jgi:hypothetical protein